MKKYTTIFLLSILSLFTIDSSMAQQVVAMPNTPLVFNKLNKNSRNTPATTRLHKISDEKGPWSEAQKNEARKAAESICNNLQVFRNMICTLDPNSAIHEALSGKTFSYTIIYGGGPGGQENDRTVKIAWTTSFSCLCVEKRAPESKKSVSDPITER